MVKMCGTVLLLMLKTGDKSSVTQILRNGYSNHERNRRAFEVIASTLPQGTTVSVAVLFP
jgi:hypothetical protein